MPHLDRGQGILQFPTAHVILMLPLIEPPAPTCLTPDDGTGCHLSLQPLTLPEPTQTLLKLDVIEPFKIVPLDKSHHLSVQISHIEDKKQRPSGPQSANYRRGPGK